jgi:hypothetical protein
VSHLE